MVARRSVGRLDLRRILTLRPKSDHLRHGRLHVLTIAEASRPSSVLVMSSGRDVVVHLPSTQAGETSLPTLANHPQMTPPLPVKLVRAYQNSFPTIRTARCLQQKPRDRGNTVTRMDELSCHELATTRIWKGRRFATKSVQKTSTCLTMQATARCK